MEDRIGWDDNYLFAIDGASGLTGVRVTSHDSDAAWLAEGLRQGLERLLPCGELSLPEILREVAGQLKEEYDGCWRAQQGDCPPDYPSAGVAILRLRDEKMEYLGLGDCTATVEDIQGAVEVLAETRLSALDRGALEKMAALCRETGCGMLQAREACNDLLIRNRNLRNRPEGYWIFDPSGAGIPHARQKSWPAGEIRAVSVMTDGFAQCVEPFQLAEDLPALHRRMREQGLAALSEELFAAQQADADCTAYPRFKTMDDTAAAWATLE